MLEYTKDMNSWDMEIAHAPMERSRIILKVQILNAGVYVPVTGGVKRSKLMRKYANYLLQQNSKMMFQEPQIRL